MRMFSAIAVYRFEDGGREVADMDRLATVSLRWIEVRKGP
jgi:hypothetical protein